MRMRRLVSSTSFRTLVVFLLTCAFVSTPALSQQSATVSTAQGESTIEGVVVSAGRESIVVRGEDNQFQVFTFDQNTTRPRLLARGTRVRIVSTPGEREGARLASSVTVVEAAPGTQAGGPQQAAPVPPKVREIEGDIEEQARRWRLGVRAGAALDPELFMFGVHSQMGPIFSRKVFFRPSAEFAFGEVTDLIALNFEAVYRFSTPVRSRDWYPYVGAGPALTFIHQNFQSGRDIDFGNFDFDAGFNILAGVQRRRTFFELKTSLWSRPAPVLRFIVGYNF